jgi:hypothetical protein
LACVEEFIKGALKSGSFFRMSQKSKNVIDIFMAVDVICDWAFNSKSVGDLLEALLLGEPAYTRIVFASSTSNGHEV